MKSDVIIIGSGLGGLICAKLLAEKGKRVTVLERHSVPGGCLQSYRRHGVSFDTGLHYVGGLAEGSRLHGIFERLGLMRLPWQRLDPDGFDLVTIGGETFPFVEGYQNFADALADRFPHERAALQKYVDLMERADRLPLGDPEVQMLCSVNAYDYLHELFHDELLINVLSGNALKYELRRESLPLFNFLHATSSFIGGGAWRLQGCGDDIVRLFVSDIESMGGQVITNAQVDELIETDGLITAAVVGNASERCNPISAATPGSVLSPLRYESVSHRRRAAHYEADLFISDIHPQQTFALVKKSAKLSRLFRRRIDMLENTCGMFTVSLVTDGNIPYFNHNKYIYREANLWEPPVTGMLGSAESTPGHHNGVDRVMVSCMAGSADVSSALGAQTSPSASAHVIDLLTPVPLSLFEKWADSHVGHRPEGYKQLKEHIADECIALAASVMPELQHSVALPTISEGAQRSEALPTKYSSSPLTWRDYTLTPLGSAFGLRKDSRQPLLTILSPRTPIPNLLLTGQNLMLHGLEGVTMTALQTCKAC